MKINRLQINSYGKLKDKKIELNNGINVIYGNNESGKSTLLNFIVSTFYGISKNKNGKSITDYDKFKPLEGTDFSGKIEYELNNQEKYEVVRDFNKKNPKIYNSNYEDISSTFPIDKKTGIEFFYDQTKVDEYLFTSTIGIMQKEVELEKNHQNFLVQKLANLVGTGEDNVSYKLAMDRINRRQLDEIGSDRSKEKPINIVNKSILELENKKINLENYQNKKYEISELENEYLDNIQNLKIKNTYLKDLKKLSENKKFDKEKLQIKENIILNNSEKISELNNKLNDLKNNKENKINEIKKEKINTDNLNNLQLKNKLNKKLIILFIILLLINISTIILLNNNLKYLIFITLPLFFIISKISKNKLNKTIKINSEKNTIDLENIEIPELFEIQNIENQINLLKNQNETLNNELNDLNSKLNLKYNLEFEKLNNKYNFSKNNLVLNLDNINYELEENENELNNKNLELHKLHLNKENIEPQLDELANIEENLALKFEEKNNLENLNNSFEICKEVLEESYNEMKENITPKFTNNLSNIISIITNNKYNSVKFNDENGIMVELKNGDYFQIENLSTGTIDQLYLALRISMIDDLSTEILPIFLDETFAYYDDERLKNILRYLVSESHKRQIIIFTCSKRETTILDKLNINYNYVEL